MRLSAGAAYHRRMRLDRFTALLAAIGAAGALLALLREASWGPGLVLDSTWYLSTARNLAEGHGFVRWNGNPYEGAAPLYPLALAAPGLFGAHPAAAAGYVNAAAFGLTVFAAGLWLRDRAASVPLAVWGSGACALSLTLARPAATIQTESLFVLCSVVSLFALDRFLDGRKRSWLLAAAVAAALACLTRYVGAALVAAALPLLLLQRGAAVRDRAGCAAAYAAAALLPIGAWTLRNVLVLGSPTGYFQPTGFSLPDSLRTAISEFALWTFGQTGYGWLEALSPADPASVGDVAFTLAALLLLAACAAAGLAHLRGKGYAARLPGALAVPGAFLAAYGLVLCVQLPRSDVDLPVRYLAPMYVPALVAAALILHEFVRYASDRGMRLPVLGGRLRALGGAGRASAPALALACLLGLWLFQHAAATWADIEDWNGDPRFAFRRWTNSETMRHVRSNGLDGHVWSNETAWLFSLTEIREEYPRWLSANSPPEEVAGWIGWEIAAGREAHVVWFHGAGYGGYGYGLEDLAALPNLAVAAVTEDGAVLEAAEGAAGAAPAAGALLRAALGGARLAARSAFDVYRDGDRLIYVREDCGAGDEAPRFFLHLDPAAGSFLPWSGGGRSFDSRNFWFSEAGFRAGGRCVAVRTLPGGYASVRTGQFGPGGELWSASVALGP